MKINRTQLISELMTFCSAGSGVIIGQPGVGKSYTIAELRVQLKASDIPHLILPVERLGGASESELEAVLKRKGDIISLLGAVEKDPNVRGILIFDGFDAARGENERNSIFKLISRTVHELRGQWHTVVSVRTFDAKKSLKLLELFPDSNADVKPSQMPCRQFLIPTLNPDEIEQALEQIPDLRILRDNGTPDFKALLTVPFNLWLLKRVLDAGARVNEFSGVTSEVQLLEMYWNYRVRKPANSADREFILKTTTQLMVEDHTLTVKRDRIYKPEVRGAWKDLLSNEILTEVPDRDVGVAFTHNILFDFAVSVHLLAPEPNRLAGFIAAEPARPLFLRPSLMYHFTRLWHFDRSVFWQNFWAVVQRNEMHLRQVVRLVLPAVVVNEAQTVTDIAPLLERLRTGQPPAVDAVAFLLQALRVLESPKRSLWAEFLRLIGSHLDRRFAWDAGTVATTIIESKADLSEQTISDCGYLGRRLLHWAWNSRADLADQDWFERLSANIAIPLVAKTYATGADEARALFKEVLAVVGEPNFPVECIYRLTNEIEYLIPHDPDLVGSIYECVFGYEERSDAKTNMGGQVLPLISNRRQDYHMCRYCLLKEYPRFIAVAPLQALKAGIRSVQSFVMERHVLRYLHSGKTIEEITFTFKFRNYIAHYIPDGSVIWDDSSYPDEELQIASTIFEYMTRVAEGNRSDDLKPILEIFGREGKMAFLWSRLLAMGSENPKIFSQYLWELAIAQPIFKQSDTLYSLEAFLKRAYEFLTEHQQRHIEQEILNISETDNLEKNEWLERRCNRLLAAIPRNFLLTSAGIHLKDSLDKNDELPSNIPLSKSPSSWSKLTEEEIMEEQGADPQAPENAELRKLYRPLKDWNENNRDASQIDSLMASACAVQDFLSKANHADPKYLGRAAEHLASFASNAVRLTSDPDTPRFRMLREMVLAAATHPEPEPEPEQDLQWNSAVWSPAPRHDAAQALPRLGHFGEDAEVLSAIQKLALDPVPSVRFLLVSDLWMLAKHMPAAMWAILGQFVENEQNEVVLRGITESIGRLIHHHNEQSLLLIQKLLKRVEEENEDEEKARTYLVFMIVDYAVVYDNLWAKETIARWQSNALEYTGSMSTAGRRLIAYITPQQKREHIERSRSLLLKHLDAAASGLSSLQQHKEKDPQNDSQTKWRPLYGVIDEAVLRIYFALDINPTLKQRKDFPLNDEQRKTFFCEALPILEKIINFGEQKDTGMLLAPTAHHFMELLNGVLRYDPPLILSMASKVVTCSKRFGYNLDSMAMGETVKLVESILADYREQVQAESSIKDLLALLDAFVEAGWPAALNLVWRLDEIYR